MKNQQVKLHQTKKLLYKINKNRVKRTLDYGLDNSIYAIAWEWKTRAMEKGRRDQR